MLKFFTGERFFDNLERPVCGRIKENMKKVRMALRILECLFVYSVYKQIFFHVLEGLY